MSVVLDAERLLHCRQGRALRCCRCSGLAFSEGAKMLRIEKPYVASSENRPLLDALALSLNEHRKILVSGTKGSGKTACLLWYATNENADNPHTVLYCSAIEIQAALFIRENEPFLAKLAETPVVAIDDLELLAQHDQGDRAISLLVAERDKKKRSTVLASNVSSQDVSAKFPLLHIASFESFVVHPLDEKGRSELVRATFQARRTSKNPVLSDRSITWLTARFESSGEIETAVRFILEGADLSAGSVVEPEELAALFEA